MSISAESTTAGDITADQEYLWPTFSNLEPSEELRLLRARIAQIERQQTTNLATSENAGFVLIDALTEKLNVSINQLSLKHQGEHEELLNAHKNLIEEMKKQREMDLAELEKQNNKVAEIEQRQEKVVRLEKYQKEQQQRRRRFPLELQCELIYALPLEHASRLLLLSNGINTNCIARVRKLREKWQNRWHSTACHDRLALIGPDRLIVQYNGKANWDTANLLVDSAADLFPCVSLDSPGTKIEANFGPNFKFNISDET